MAEKDTREAGGALPLTLGCREKGPSETLRKKWGHKTNVVLRWQWRKRKPAAWVSRGRKETNYGGSSPTSRRGPSVQTRWDKKQTLRCLF